MKKILPVLLALLFLLAALTACAPATTTVADQTTTAAGQTTQKESATAGQTSSQPEAGAEEFAGYPMDSLDQTLVIYVASNGIPLNAAYTSFADSPWHSGVSERVGVNVEWQKPPAGADVNQALNLLLVSGELPDIIYAGAMHTNAADFLNDEYIIPLTDVLPDHAPALYSFLTENEHYARAIRTDEGDYYCFPFFREDLWLGTFEGPMVRQDLLDQAGLDVPVTIDDWDHMLHEFADLVEIPFGTWGGIVFNYIFTNAYDFTLGFYVDENQQVQYGYARDEYLEFLTLINKWYTDGLIDPDFATNDRAGLKTKVMNSLVGACRTSGATLSGYLVEMEELGMTDTWVAAQYPVKRAGKPIRFIQGETYFVGQGAVITTACEEAELAARVLDWFFTAEGIEYTNFGAEGWIMAYDNEGKPYFTEEALNDPEGFNNILSRYNGNSSNGLGFMLVDMYRQKTADVACAAIDTWYYGADHSSRLPAITPTTVENNAIASSLTQITTLASEMFYNFVMGEEPLTNFDTYQAQLYDLGLEDILAIRTTQLERYLNR